MLDLANHPYFEEYTDPKSGVKSYILKQRVAQLQQNFYFTEVGMTEDNQYMWFKCLNWPARYAYLGVMSMNEEEPFIRGFPGAGLQGGCPTVIPGTHDALFSVGPELYRINIEGNITKLWEIDPEFIGFRNFQRLSTHLSLNQTGELILLDMRIADKSYVAVADFKTGEMKLIHKFNRHYNHAHFSPTDPELFLIDQDWERDSQTGERFDVDQRMWLMDIGGTRMEVVEPQNWFRHGSLICHDFWSRDGYLCWPDLIDSVYEYNVYTKKRTLVWSREICHCHTLDRKLWVGDASPYRWSAETPCRTIFFDRESGKEIDIFSGLPLPKYRTGGEYHLDPHPQFTLDGQYILSMTTVNNGEIDLAITPVAPLLEQCRKTGNPINAPWREGV